MSSYISDPLDTCEKALKAAESGVTLRAECLREIRKVMRSNDPCSYCQMREEDCFERDDLCPHKSMIEEIRGLLNRCEYDCEMSKV